MSTDETITPNMKKQSLWCLKHTKGGSAAQMPREGILLSFPSFDDAKAYRRMVIADVDSWTPCPVTRIDITAHRGVALWQQVEPLHYMIFSETTACLKR